MKNVLIMSQVIPQWYVDTLTNAMGENVHIDIITGSHVEGNVISSPQHDPRSLKSRFVCWGKHYLFMQKWINKNRKKHYDLIFAVSNPPINSQIGLKLKRVFHAPFIYMNWDLYPQVVETSIGNPIAKIICKMWHGWNKRNYPKIDCMLTIGNVMSQSMTCNISKKINVQVIPIAADTEQLHPIERIKNVFAQQYGLTDKFVVLYSGKMGIGHNIELILEAAKKLEAYSKIQFVFIGEGQKYALVEDYLREYKSPNILLLPLQPKEVFPQSIACGDIGVISQEATLAHLFMPSKTYSMMACGEAIIGICTENDDLHGLLTENDIGCAVTDGSADTLANSILNLYQDRERLQKCKNNARNLAEESFSQSAIQEKYRKLFNSYL